MQYFNCKNEERSQMVNIKDADLLLEFSRIKGKYEFSVRRSAKRTS